MGWHVGRRWNAGATSCAPPARGRCGRAGARPSREGVMRSQQVATLPRGGDAVARERGDLAQRPHAFGFLFSLKCLATGLTK